LDALVKDARISIADLARSVDLSPPSVSERIRRLEEAGVIEGYTLTINPKALGLPIAAWLRMTMNAHNDKREPAPECRLTPPPSCEMPG
jgi:DNA-binding Lrp family transcriptional regulator